MLRREIKTGDVFVQFKMINIKEANLLQKLKDNEARSLVRTAGIRMERPRKAARRDRT